MGGSMQGIVGLASPLHTLNSTIFQLGQTNCKKIYYSFGALLFAKICPNMPKFDGINFKLIKFDQTCPKFGTALSLLFSKYVQLFFIHNRRHMNCVKVYSLCA